MLNVAAHIDHTILRPTTIPDDIKKLCAEAADFRFAAVCVPPPFVKNCRKYLAGTQVKVATVVGFPFGYSVAKAKLAETQQAIADGADELDVVVNLIALKSGSWSYLEAEMNMLVTEIHGNNRLLKVIIESGILSDEEIIQCCRVYGQLGIDYLKTSTGYAEKGATLHAVQLMKQNLASGIKIKASGGIKTYASALEYINAGADRIGTSSGVNIMNEVKQIES